ncbi:MAG: TfpX/TfpZ family type IV pilin accessory protein [Noviherbaspirillum sp.]
MNRFKASSIHFLCSAVVLLLIFVLVRWIWYPGQLFEAASGVDLIVILVSVDVVLGPLITLVIFKPKKSSLKFDMACVVALQVVFMAYGVWAIFSARPVYMAFVENRFYLVTANQIDPEDQRKAAKPAFQSLPWLGPEVVGTTMPLDPNVIKNLFWAAPSGLGLHNLPQYFLAYAEVASQAKSAAKTAQELAAKGKATSIEDLGTLAAYETKKRAEGKQVLFVPLLNQKKILNVVIDASTGAVVEVL